MPVEVRVDGLLVDLVPWCYDHRAVGRRLVIVEPLVVDGDAEEARRAVRDVAGVLLLERTPYALFPFVDAEHELRARPAIDAVNW